MCICPNPQPSQREPKTLSSSLAPPRTPVSTSPCFARRKKNRIAVAVALFHRLNPAHSFSYPISNENYICQHDLRKHRVCHFGTLFCVTGSLHPDRRIAQRAPPKPPCARRTSCELIDTAVCLLFARLARNIGGQVLQKRSSYMWL